MEDKAVSSQADLGIQVRHSSTMIFMVKQNRTFTLKNDRCDVRWF